jgi:hypothetical protein
MTVAMTEREKLKRQILELDSIVKANALVLGGSFRVCIRIGRAPDVHLEAVA